MATKGGVHMKKALVKDSVKQIKNTYKRFLSILLMAFLGVGFFAGIKATSPDMVDTIDKYYKEQNVYDIQVMSTLGLTIDDINELSKVENVEEVQGTFEKEAKIEIENAETIVKLLCVDDINAPVLVDGNLPQSENECVVEASFLKNKKKQIGDYLDIDAEATTNDNGDEVQYLKQNKVKIVGVVESPLYISRDRGTSTLGIGKIDYFVYLSKDNINANDIYTQIYIKVKDANTYTTSTDEYKKYIQTVKNSIEDIKEDREKARYNALINSATHKLNDAQNELNTQKADAQSKIDEAEQKIQDGKNQIQTGEHEIESNKKKADAQFANAEAQIKSGKQQIQNSKKELENKETEANRQFTDLETQKQGLQINLQTVNSGLEQINAQYNQIVESLKNLLLPADQRTFLEQTKQTLETQIGQLQANKTQLESGIKQIEDGIANGKQELSNAKGQIATAEKELKSKEQALNKTKKTTYSQIESAKAKLEESKKEIETGEQELTQNKQEFEEKIQDAENKLTDAKAKIADIESPTWYIFGRDKNEGYTSFIQDTQSIKNIGTVFPVIFFVVATLISLNSMTRMVEEQRTQIGTLKAFGYNKIQIISKYVIYASLATIIGGVLGMCVGFIIIPKIIFMMYQMMYQISNFVIKFNAFYGFIGLLLISVCIIGATMYSALKELVQTPATLMRPKAPKVGKKVLLERIPFIWKHLKFTRKVTVRNIFRYKKRFLMTIIGIAGCTALILSGFGIRDSIKSLIPMQFGDVFNYDMQVSLKKGITEEEKNIYVQELQDKPEIEKVVKTYMTATTIENIESNGNVEDSEEIGKSEDAIIIVPDDQNNLQGLINIKDAKTKQKVELQENQICITDKVSELLGVKAGDTVKLKDSDDKQIDVKISNIVQNYVSHYVYMSKQTYENLYKKEYTTNVIYTKNAELTQEQTDNLSKEIMSNSKVGGESVITNLTSQIDNMMSSMNYVVMVLIVSAGLLALVVLYNLSNVNISERIRELATIKVLGFYDREVYSYVTRETVILTVIGIVLGLISGYFLNKFILTTCEINMLRFNQIVNPISYVYAILIIVGFTVIVNVTTYFALKKIDMIESLKSVE